MTLALAAMVATALWRTLPFLGPVPPEGLYNSDSAIPVLMANLATAAPVDWLFWGQDRFGSWPFLLARGLGAPFGAAWTPHALHGLRTLWRVAALFPWTRLAGRAGGVAAAGLLLLPWLNPLLGRVLVDLGTVDGWQLPALLWAWWGLRRAALDPRAARWLALASVGGGLATWTSLVSAPLLAVLAALEGVGARVRGARRRLLLFLPALAGLLVESVVRRTWHAVVRARGWPDLRTPARLDTGHLVENLIEVTATAFRTGAMPWLVLAVAAALVAAARFRPSQKTPEQWTLIGCGATSLVALLIIVSVRHVRDNGYNPRYLGVGLWMAVLGASVLVGLGVHWLQTRVPARRVPPLTALAGLGAVLLLARGATPDPRERVLRPAAREIAARYPGAVLAATYWRTYALAGLLPPWTVIPVPREGEWNRRPDWAAFLGSGRPVLVGRLDTEGEPPGALVERGVGLVLVRPDVLSIPPFPAESTGERLSLYRLAADTTP